MPIKSKHSVASLSTLKERYPGFPKSVRQNIQTRWYSLDRAIEESWDQTARAMDWGELCAMTLGLCEEVGFHESAAMMRQLADRIESGFFGGTGHDE